MSKAARRVSRANGHRSKQPRIDAAHEAVVSAMPTGVDAPISVPVPRSEVAMMLPGMLMSFGEVLPSEQIERLMRVIDAAPDLSVTAGGQIIFRLVLL